MMHWIFTLGFCLSVTLTQAQSITTTVLSNTQTQTVLDIRIAAPQLTEVQTPRGKAHKILLKGTTSILQKGAPDIPKLSIPLLIPNQSNSIVEVLESEYTEQPNVLIAPGKGRITRPTIPSDLPYKFGQEYSNDAFFPAATATMQTPYILRDFRGQTLSIFPVQYNPVTGVLRTYTRFKVQVRYEGSSSVNVQESDIKPTHISEEYDGIYQNHFVNYKKKTRYNPVTELGSMLIICPSNFIGEMQPFIEWKERKGIKTYVAISDTITGGANETTLKNLTTWYFNNKQITYLLIVGDHMHIPPVTNSTLVSGPSDNAYAYISGNDHYPEFVVGRFSGETTTDIRTQVTRTIAYEKTPNTTGNWMSTQVGVASAQGPGDDNQYDFEHMHEIVDSNKNQYVYQTNIELYDDTCTSTATLLGNDALGFPITTMLRDAINGGTSLINYVGHGNSDGVLTTNFNSTDIPSLNNNNALPFFFTVGCRPGSFVSYTCFAENMQRASNASGPFGTISCFMSTIDQYWDEPMEAQDEFNAILRGSRPSNIKQRLGPMCIDACMSMNDKYNTVADPKGGSDMTDTWVYFGDPSISLYTSNQGNLSISNAMHIQQNATSFEVNCATDGTIIGLYYQQGYLASSVAYGGKAYFSFPALTALDTVYITATKQNFTPAFGKAIVVNWPNSIQEQATWGNIQVYPNPVSDMLHIMSDETHPIEKVRVFELTGRNCITEIATEGSNMTIPMMTLSPGMYLVEVSSREKSMVKRIIKQ